MGNVIKINGFMCDYNKTLHLESQTSLAVDFARTNEQTIEWTNEQAKYKALMLTCDS